MHVWDGWGSPGGKGGRREEGKEGGERQRDALSPLKAAGLACPPHTFYSSEHRVHRGDLEVIQGL